MEKWGKVMLYGGTAGILIFGAMLDSPFWQLPLLIVMLSLAVAVGGYRRIDVEKFIEGSDKSDGTERLQRNREATFRTWVRS